MENQTVRMLRLPAVCDATGRGRSTLYAEIAAGLFPKAVALGPRNKAWPEHEVNAINRARIAGQGDEALRTLVREIETGRVNAFRG